MAGAALLLLLALLIVLLARVRPGFDPYGWLGWGKLTLHGKLDTNGAPSWKPLPFLFTVPYALAGHYALWLWMVTSVATSLSALVFAWRVAFRLTVATTPARWAPHVAGAFAALALLGIRDYSHFILSAQSDTMIVALCLAAIDCQLSGRSRWALWLWVLAALGRPEAWPFLGLYAAWCWRTQPELRTVVAGSVAVVPLLWFGIPALTAKTFFVAGQNALHSPRQLHQSRVFGTVDRFFDLQETTVWLAAGLCVALAVRRRSRILLVLGAGILGWLAIEVGFVLHGWPGVPRYLFEPVGVACVLAGVFVGRVAGELPSAVGRVTALRSASQLAPRLGALAAGLILAAVIVPLAPAAQARWKVESRDLAHEHARATAFNRLYSVVQHIGGARMLACGRINIPVGYQSVLAWYLGIRTGVLFIDRAEERLRPTPLVNLYPARDGWKVFPSHVTAAGQARCHGLTRTFRFPS